MTPEQVRQVFDKAWYAERQDEAGARVLAEYGERLCDPALHREIARRVYAAMNGPVCEMPTEDDIERELIDSGSRR